MPRFALFHAGIGEMFRPFRFDHIRTTLPALFH